MESQSEIVKVWITKRALTVGIVVKNVMIDHNDPNTCIYHDTCHHGVNTHLRYPHWHLKKENAVARAEIMRLSKIAALKQQTYKLQQMTFDAPD